MWTTVSTFNNITDTLQFFHYDWPQVMFIFGLKCLIQIRVMASSDELENLHMTP